MRHLFVFMALYIVLITKAQDIHFSQYYLSPLSLNPANTGNDKCDYRFFGNYRNQWRELNNAYKTYSAGGDFSIYPANLHLSGGMLLISDNSGANLSVLKFMPSGAWHFKLRGYRFHLGLQPGVVTKSINFNALTFPEQFNWSNGQFDRTLPNHEANGLQRQTYFDFNAGAGISKRFQNVEPEVGFALFHINRPKESFVGNSDNKLPLKHISNLALNFYAGNKTIIRLHSLVGVTTKVNDWVSGLNLEYVLLKLPYYTNSVYAGFMWRGGINRNQDAGIATAGITYVNWTLGFSYDVTFSDLKTSVNSKGAYEIALIVRGKNTRLSQKILPCERY